jgi:hypothetical protein
MASKKSDATASLSPSRQLTALIAKLPPGPQKLLRAARTNLRKRFPTANELVYEYARSLVLSYSATERGGEAVVALSATADGVTLHLNHGPRLKDPHGLLQGNGRAMREIPLESARTLSRPEVIALMNAAARLTKPALARTGKGVVVIKSGSPKRATRPRRS